MPDCPVCETYLKADEWNSGVCPVCASEVGDDVVLEFPAESDDSLCFTEEDRLGWCIVYTGLSIISVSLTAFLILGFLALIPLSGATADFTPTVIAIVQMAAALMPIFAIAGMVGIPVCGGIPRAIGARRWIVAWVICMSLTGVCSIAELIVENRIRFEHYRSRMETRGTSIHFIDEDYYVKPNVGIPQSRNDEFALLLIRWTRGAVFVVAWVFFGVYLIRLSAALKRRVLSRWLVAVSIALAPLALSFLVLYGLGSNWWNDNRPILFRGNDVSVDGVGVLFAACLMLLGVTVFPTIAFATATLRKSIRQMLRDGTMIGNS